MEVRAIAKSVRVSPRKLRLVADAVRHLSIDHALSVLQATQKRASTPMIKALQSAVANATTNNNLDRNNLMIRTIMINDAQALKRFHPTSRGRVHPYKKRGSHITVVLQEKTKSVVAPAKSAAEKKGGK